MSDDAPLEPVAPEPATPAAPPVATGTVPTPPAASEAPTAEAPAQAGADAAPPGPPPWTAPPGGSDTPGSPKSSTVAVPKWVLAVVGAIVIAAIGFGVGYAVAPGGDDSSAQTRVVPSPFGGNGNGNGNGGQLPTIPVPDQRDLQGAFLGVVSTRSTDPDGARITQVVPSSPADDAGLGTDDVITKVDGDTITTPAELAERIQDHDSGDEVTITYVRDGDTKTTDVKLTSRRNGLRFSTPSTTSPGQ